MRYLGGKAKIAKQVAAVVAEYRGAGQPVWEPFCGGLNSAVAHGGIVVATDASRPLIALLQAVQNGWDPPAHLSEAEWHDAKELPETNPLHGFAAFGCSFGGKYFGGYASGEARNYAAESRRALLRDVPKVSVIERVDFLTTDPEPINWLVYCDPPYRGRTRYAMGFNHDRFVDRVSQWASCGVTLLISEYDFPLGVCVWEHTRVAALRGAEKTHTERIYLVRGNDRTNGKAKLRCG